MRVFGGVQGERIPPSRGKEVLFRAISLGVAPVT